MDTLERELTALLNRHSAENASNTPDFILADFLRSCLGAWNHATKERDRWYGIAPRPGSSELPPGMERSTSADSAPPEGNRG